MNWLNKMNWSEAVAAMKVGKPVQRASEQTRKLIGHSDGIPIYECGEEACMLAHAWTDDERPVMVFRGVGSGQLFVPESEHREATDWVIA